MDHRKISFAHNIEGYEINVTATINPGFPGRLHGHPDDMEPPEPATIDEVVLTYKGEQLTGAFAVDLATELEGSIWDHYDEILGRLRRRKHFFAWHRAYKEGA